MDIVFWGTPALAVPTLELLYKKNYNIKAVITNPDKVKGRGGKVQKTEIRIAAENLGLPVLTPLKVRDEEFLKTLESLEADFYVVFAYGHILPKRVLDLAKKACINIHPSKLPVYRGPSPIQWAVLNGDKETAISIMLMSEACDAGDILRQEIFPIAENETSASLFEKLAEPSANLLCETLENFDSITPMKQDENKATFSKMIEKDDGKISPSDLAEVVERKIRAYNPWPGSYIKKSGKTYKIWKGKVGPDLHLPKGTITKDLKLQLNSSSLSILEIQPEGKSKMDVKAFLNGNNIEGLID